MYFRANADVYWNNVVFSRVCEIKSFRAVDVYENNVFSDYVKLSFRAVADVYENNVIF